MGTEPQPMPSSKRPPEAWSSDTAWRASTAGWRKASQSTRWPMVSRVVWAASQAAVTMASTSAGRRPAAGPGGPSGRCRRSRRPPRPGPWRPSTRAASASAGEDVDLDHGGNVLRAATSSSRPVRPPTPDQRVREAGGHESGHLRREARGAAGGELPVQPIRDQRGIAVGGPHRGVGVAAGQLGQPIGRSPSPAAGLLRARRRRASRRRSPHASSTRRPSSRSSHPAWPTARDGPRPPARLQVPDSAMHPPGAGRRGRRRRWCGATRCR